MEKIAVFTDEKREMTGFYNCSKIIKYEQTKEGIIKTDEIAYPSIQITNANEIRAQIKQLLSFLEKSTILVFHDIAGMAYSVFDRAGYLIFTVSDYEISTLENIVQDVRLEIQEQEKERTRCLKVPVEKNENGIYYFDLSSALAEDPETSSKKLLQEFFRTVPFVELHLKCDHIPKWIEQDKKFEIKTQIIEEKEMCIITPEKTRSCFR